MGEIAEDVIRGFGCSGCGVYFEREHGYPVLCEDCWQEASEGDRDALDTLGVQALGVQRAIHPEL